MSARLGNKLPVSLPHSNSQNIAARQQSAREHERQASQGPEAACNVCSFRGAASPGPPWLPGTQCTAVFQPTQSATSVCTHAPTHMITNPLPTCAHSSLTSSAIHTYKLKHQARTGTHTTTTPPRTTVEKRTMTGVWTPGARRKSAHVKWLTSCVTCA